MKEQGAYPYHSSSCSISTTSTTNSICCDDVTAPSTTTSIFNVASVSNPSLQNIGGRHQSLHDIFQYLSEVPLHATVTPPLSQPGLDYHHCDDFFYKEGYGPVQIVDQDYHNKGPDVKNLDAGEAHSKGKQLMEPDRMPSPHHQCLTDSLRGPKIKDTTDLSKERSKGKQPLEPEVPHKPHPENQHDISRKRLRKRTNENRRRHRINAKLRAVKALLPNRDKGDHVSILDHAIEYIKSMKLQIDVMSSRQRQLQPLQTTVPTYAPQMTMQPRMFHEIGFGAWGSQTTYPGYPLMVQPYGFGGSAFPFQPNPQAQVGQVPIMPGLRPPQFFPTPIGTPLTPGAWPFAPPQRRFTPPSSSDQAPRFQPPATR